MNGTLTAVVLTLDAAASLPATLDALRATSVPTLVVDSGSTDGTVAIAEAAGAVVLHRPFDDFAAQRNWALDQVDTPYVLFVDADELVTPELLAAVAAAIDDDVDAAWVPTLDYFAGRWLLHGLAHPQPHLRLLRRAVCRYEGAVHESVVVAGREPRVVTLEPPLVHLSHLTLSHYLRKLDRYTEVEAAAQRGGRAWLVLRGVIEAVAVVARALVVRQGWRDGAHGVVLAVAYGFYRFTIYAKAALAQRPDEPTAAVAMARWRATRPPSE